MPKKGILIEGTTYIKHSGIFLKKQKIEKNDEIVYGKDENPMGQSLMSLKVRLNWYIFKNFKKPVANSPLNKKDLV